MKNKKYFLTLFLTLTFSFAGFFFFSQSASAIIPMCVDDSNNIVLCPESTGSSGGGVVEDTSFFFLGAAGSGGTKTASPGSNVTIRFNGDIIAETPFSGICPAISNKPIFSIKSPGVTFNESGGVFPVNPPKEGSFPLSPRTTCGFDFGCGGTLNYEWSIPSGIPDRPRNTTITRDWTFTAPSTPGNYTISVAKGYQKTQKYDSCEQYIGFTDSGGPTFITHYLLYGIEKASRRNLTLTVETPTPVPPVLTDPDFASVAPGESVKIYALANDTNPIEGPLNFENLALTEGGEFTISSWEPPTIYTSQGKVACYDISWWDFPSSPGRPVYSFPDDVLGLMSPEPSLEPGYLPSLTTDDIHNSIYCLYTANSDASGTDSFAYKTLPFDGYSSTAVSPGIATVTITITPPSPSSTAPTITSRPATSVTTTTATLNANVTSVGNPAYTVKGFCYGTSANPSKTNGATCSTVSGSGTGAFIKALTSLSSGARYYYRGYATNTVDTVYSDDVIFDTVPVPPSGVLVSPGKCGTGTIDVSWDPPTSRGYTYNVFRGVPVAGNVPVKIASDIPNFSFEDTGLTAGNSYYYKVQSIKNSATSTLSAAITTTAPRVCDSMATINVSSNMDNTFYNISGAPLDLTIDTAGEIKSHTVGPASGGTDYSSYVIPKARSGYNHSVLWSGSSTLKSGDTVNATITYTKKVGTVKVVNYVNPNQNITFNLMANGVTTSVSAGRGTATRSYMAIGDYTIYVVNPPSGFNTVVRNGAGVELTSPYTQTLSEGGTIEYRVSFMAIPATGDPSVVINTPTDGSTKSVGSTVDLTSTATPQGSARITGGITYYYNKGSGDVLIGTSDPRDADNVFIWNAASAGVYAITAVATDSNGKSGTSAPVNITIGENIATIEVTSNKGDVGFRILQHASIEGLDESGRVDTDGGINTYTATLGPEVSKIYSFRALNTISGFTRTIKSLINGVQSNSTTNSRLDATVRTGQTLTFQIVYTADPADPLDPTVSISSNKDTYTLGETVLLSSTASDSDGSVEKVEYYKDSTLLGAGSEYSYSWTPTSNGTYTVKATATDNVGRTADSSKTITVSDPVDGGGGGGSGTGGTAVIEAKIKDSSEAWSSDNRIEDAGGSSVTFSLRGSCGESARLEGPGVDKSYTYPFYFAEATVSAGDSSPYSMSCVSGGETFTDSIILTVPVTFSLRQIGDLIFNGITGWSNWVKVVVDSIGGFAAPILFNAESRDVSAIPNDDIQIATPDTRDTPEATVEVSSSDYGNGINLRVYIAKSLPTSITTSLADAQYKIKVTGRGGSPEQIRIKDVILNLYNPENMYIREF